MWRHFGGVIPTGYVVIITSGAANAAPGGVSLSTAAWAAADAGSGEGGKAIWRGGKQHTITDAEDVILRAAGYTTSESGGG